jgi:hypothetical protein
MRVVNAVDETEHKFVIRFVAMAKAVLGEYLPEHVFQINNCGRHFKSHDCFDNHKKPCDKNKAF